MKLRQIKLISWGVAAVLILGFWVIFGPTKLGGSTTYSITSGISMEPLLHKNNLALVRAQPSYRVHDVVLYQSQVLHKPVLHRIILIQNGNYFFKGDNNNFVDPGYAIQSELIGKLWLHVPAVGGALGWFGKPSHAALLTGLVIVLFVLAGFTTAKHRHHRRDKPPIHKLQLTKDPPPHKSALLETAPAPSESSPITTDPKQIPSPRTPSYFEGPTSTLIALGILLSLAILFLIMGFSRPSHHIAPLPDAYKQSGNFTYTGLVKTPTIVYPEGGPKTGDPIFPSLVESATVHFKYQFTSDLPHNIKGTIALKALLLSKSDTWRNLTVLKPATKFSGDSTIITSDVSLSDLYGLINSVSEQSESSTNYSADVDPVVHITGTVGGKPINDTFEPVLPFSIGKSVITLNAATTSAPAGATYVPPSEDTTRALTLNPSKAGSIPHLADNTVSVAKYQVKVPLIRLYGLLFALLALGVAILHDNLRRRQKVPSPDDVIADQFQSLMVPVSAIATPPGVTAIEISDLAHLAELAHYLERPILYDARSKHRTYVVDDGACQYVAHLSQATLHPAAAQTTHRHARLRQPLTVPVFYHRAKKSIVVRVLAGFVVLAIIASLVTSLTASNTVPASKVGRSVNARTIPQLSPTGCNTLTLTSIVFKSAGTSSNTTSNALIVGTSGVETLTDTGNNNCIVGGAGKDNITARSTSICIVGPTTGATYTTCTKK